MRGPVSLWLAAFVETTGIEAVVVLLLTRGSATPAWRRLTLVTYAQLATHPLVWFVFPYVAGLRGGTALLLGELWACLAEGVLYALTFEGTTLPRALGISTVANAASVLAGAALSHLGVGAR